MCVLQDFEALTPNLLARTIGKKVLRTVPIYRYKIVADIVKLLAVYS